ncbi:MAG: FtsW/RodA/SpoVE family cell cycle protein [Alphaproteobacteria bacterium]|nr:FtsW/RodA/SpoVE family cell cycle protein [Alphaproteobacteria bacterium]
MKLYNRNSKNIAKWWYSLDHNIIFSFIMLLLVGLIMSKSASTNVAEKIGLDALYFYHKHILFVILAILAALFFSLLKPNVILRFSLLLLLLSLMLVVIIIFTEDHTKGAKRWLRIAGLTIQPSEFIKPFFIVINAWFLSRKFIRDDINGYIISTILFLTIIFCLAMQPDIGMSLNFIAVWSIQVFMSGISYFIIIILLGLALIGVILAYFSFGHVKYRIDSFLFSDGAPSYQISKSLKAIDSGGFFGKGIFEGEVKNVLPDSHTDFIFAAMMEEFGLIVTFIILSLYFLIIFRIFIHTKLAKDNFIIILLVGIAVQIAFQIFVNVGVNMNILPTKGTTLPFISYGGSSLLAMGILTGILLSACREQFGRLKNYK